MIEHHKCWPGAGESGPEARGRGPGELGRARGARGRPLAHLPCRSALSARFELAFRSPTSERSALSRSAESARPARTRRKRRVRSERHCQRRTVSAPPASGGGLRKVGGATGRPRRLAYSSSDAAGVLCAARCGWGSTWCR